MRRRAFLTAVPVVAGATGLLASRVAQAAPAVTYTNSLIARRADPYIYKHTDGFYYFTASVPQHDRVVRRRATTLQGPGKRAGDDDLGASTPAGSSLPPTPGASDTRRTTCNHRKGA